MSAYVLLFCSVLYNRGRPHRALDLVPPSGFVPVAASVRGRVSARPALGGLVYEYEWEAA